VTPGVLLERLCAVALMGVIVGVLAMSSRAAFGDDGGVPRDVVVAGGPDGAATAPARFDAGVLRGPDAGADRRRQRQLRRFGMPFNFDGGVPRDAGFRPPRVVPAPVVPQPPPPPPPVPAAPTAPSPPSDVPFNTCQKIPAGKRIVKMNLKPDSELPTVVAWISSITCKPFVLPSHLSSSGKKITVVAPNLMTRDEAYASFLNALDAIGLAVERSGGILKVIETAKAKSSSIPVYDFDGQPTR
jgi:hypothetical protein